MEPRLEHGQPFLIHRERVRPEWIDYNGHMNVAYYVLAFDQATDALFDFVGLHDAYRRAHDVSTFALESHVCYLSEVAEGDELVFHMQLLDRDERFFHQFYWMTRGSDGKLAATSEWVSVHMDMKIRRPAPFLPDMDARFGELWQAHKDLPRPAQAGRTIGIRRK